MRAVILVLGTLASSNCAAAVVAPIAVTSVSAAASDVSYIATGKGASDLVILAIAEQDGALRRAFTEDDICLPGIPPPISLRTRTGAVASGTVP